MFDDRVRLLGLETRPVVDAAPRDGDGVHPGCLRRADVEGRVADVGRRGGIGSEALGPEKKRLGIRLVTLGLVAADDHLEEMAERDDRERELSRVAPLGGDDAEPPAFGVQPREHALHPDARLELVVERDVVCAIDVHQLVARSGSMASICASRPGPPTVFISSSSVYSRAEHLARGVAHRREDDRAGVDDRAVEVEENGRKSHCG